MLRRWRETGSIAPKPHGGGRQAKIAGKKLERLKALAEETPDAEVWFLPRYSPDYNPIEEMWPKVKPIFDSSSPEFGLPWT